MDGNDTYQDSTSKSKFSMANAMAGMLASGDTRGLVSGLQHMYDCIDAVDVGAWWWWSGGTRQFWYWRARVDPHEHTALCRSMYMCVLTSSAYVLTVCRAFRSPAIKTNQGQAMHAKHPLGFRGLSQLTFEVKRLASNRSIGKGDGVQLPSRQELLVRWLPCACGESDTTSKNNVNGACFFLPTLWPPVETAWLRTPA